jgi:NAD(P)-dependent dehydrogenase (short-subunit alcohol dehydrogenase family)
MSGIAVVTGASAGVGRAVVDEFARNGFDVALLARDPTRLETAASEARRYGRRALAIPTDVAEADAVDAAADVVERDLGPIDVWVNVAMATVFAPVSKLHAAEFQRGTAVTYLGQVHGTIAGQSYASAPRWPIGPSRFNRSIAAQSLPFAASSMLCVRSFIMTGAPSR